MSETTVLSLPVPSLEDFWSYGPVRRMLGSRPREDLRDMAEALVARAPDYMEPRAVLTTLSLRSVGERRVELEDGTVFESPNLALILRGSREACLYVLTLGPGVDREMGCANDDPAKLLASVVVGVIASVAIHKLGTRIVSTVKDRFAEPRGLGATCRFGPGQSHWPIREQRKLFAVCDAGRIGVRLTESCLMVPTKSISGLIGIGPKERISTVGSACELCPKMDCSNRRVGPEDDTFM